MFDLTIIGAGIVGLAAGLKILEYDNKLKVLILEKENAIAQHQTGNNSGVIHSGIYYKPNSLKALNCRKGYELLLEYCNKENIDYNICGKIIVAVSTSELNYLDNIYQNGLAHGLRGLKKIGVSELKEIEPNVDGMAGLLVPQTGIIDYKQVADSFKEKIIKNNGVLNFNQKVINIIDNKNSFIIKTPVNSYESRFVLSCAGLQSDEIAKMTDPQSQLKIIPFRGEYYKLKKESEHLVKALIYPVPDPAFPFLGVHFTKRINGEIEAGPNAVFAFAKEGYAKTDIDFSYLRSVLFWRGFRIIAKKHWKTGIGEFYRSYFKCAFVKSLQRLLPIIESKDLLPGGAGIRAQVCDTEGNLIDDFLFVEGERYLHVCNAPSPAATASLAIGETIRAKLIEKMRI